VAEEDTPPDRITVGHGTMITAIAAVIGATVWITTYATNSQGTAHDLTQFEANTSSQLADIRTGFTAGLTSIQQQVAILPDQRARLDQVERRISGLEERNTHSDEKLEQIELALTELRADLALQPSRLAPITSEPVRKTPR
jgi:uncharacterized coiled-coil protein SlyX